MNPELLLAIALATIVPFTMPSTTNRTFYLDPAGDDANDGLSAAKPWKSLSKIEQARLQPGDQVLLAAGKTFSGSFRLPAKISGTPEKPIVIQSSGASRAVILSSTNTAISIAGGGVEIRDLILKGDAKANIDKQNGI